MQYPHEVIGDYTVVHWQGDMDMAHAPDARAQALQLLYDRQPLAIDLSGVTHIDSSGVAVLVEAHQDAVKKKLRFGILAPSRAVLEVLRLARLVEILPIHTSLDTLSSRVPP